MLIDLGKLVLKLSKKRVKENIRKLAIVSDIEFKEMPNATTVTYGHSYDTRNFRELLPAFAAINSIIETLRDEGRIKDTKEVLVLQIAGGYCQLGSLLDHLGVEHLITDVEFKNLVHGRNHGTESGIAAEAGTLPFKDNSTDIVVSDHFLFSRYPAIRGASELAILEETKRVLKQEGLLVISRSYSKIKEYCDAPIYTEGWAVIYDEKLSSKESYIRLAILQKRD